jgi:geranylgeranyl diphosphate synthase, type II
MTNVDLAKSYLEEQGQRVSAYLETLFSNDAVPERLFSAMNYSLLAGGKRLRPVLCLATAKTFGIDEEAVLPAAAAIELIHTYSLIHDDLPCMDNDDLRRGKPTNHRVYGEATALLAGDALLTYAFEQLSKPMGIPAERQLALIRTLARAAGSYGMVGGQMADIEAERSGGTLADLEFIHLHKTAKLIAASIEMGSWFADVEPTQREALINFGDALGLAFQIVDDILDVVGDTEVLGKTVGMDHKLQKLTYPSLIGLEASKLKAQELIRDGIHALHQSNIESELLEGIARYIVERNH